MLKNANVSPHTWRLILMPSMFQHLPQKPHKSFFPIHSFFPDLIIKSLFEQSPLLPFILMLLDP